MSGRDPTGYARRNRVPLALLFAGFVLFGLMRENGAAFLGGLGGLAWVALASWGRR